MLRHPTQYFIIFLVNGSTASGLINGNKSREKEYEDVKTTKSEQYHTPHYTITHRGHFDIQVSLPTRLLN